MDDTEALFDVFDDDDVVAEVKDQTAPVNTPVDSPHLPESPNVLLETMPKDSGSLDSYSWNVIETKILEDDKVRIDFKHLWKVAKSIEFVTNNNHNSTYDLYNENYDPVKSPYALVNWKEGFEDYVFKNTLILN